MMKFRRFFTFAIFVPGLFCLGQAPEPASKPADAPAPPPAQAVPAPSQAAPSPAATAPAQAAPAPAPAATASAPAAPADATVAPAQAPVTPVAAPGAPAIAPAGAAAKDSYVIGASDVLSVTVWKEPTLSGTMLVRPDGMISMPLLGDVQSAGLTPLQLSDQIAAKLKKFIQDPNVSVLISQIHSKVVYLLGEVMKKGPVDMTPGMTLLQAVGSGGGLTDFANKKKIYILRDEAGKHERIPVHYREALKGNSSLDLVLKPGDTIVVP
jgi:polysaccharide export outer membrane protein